MLWMEMSRHLKHGGGAWEFGKSLWSPSQKENGSSWPYWENLLRVEEGDSVLHLRGQKKDIKFVGFSLAATDGFETLEHPPDPDRYSYADSFYRVILKDFEPLPDPIRVYSLFLSKDEAFRRYYRKNRNLSPGRRKSLFFTIQGGRLQCQNGAYLTEVDKDLATLLFGGEFRLSTDDRNSVRTSVSTGESLSELRARVGQKEFSDSVRDAYGHRCAFPDCGVANDTFLIASHIARWADVPELRGEVSNGICLCLMHDKAFERGLFTLSADLRIVIARGHHAIRESYWCRKKLLPHEDDRLRVGSIAPTIEALEHHWERIGFRP